jgi:hypothetical protein
MKPTKEFAAIMRELTNFIFLFLKDTWEEHAAGDQNIMQQYQAINDVLTNTFERLLINLSTASSYDTLQIEESAKKAIKMIINN